jgi:hypothetical protein
MARKFKVMLGGMVISMNHDTRRQANSSKNLFKRERSGVVADPTIYRQPANAKLRVEEYDDGK